MRDVELGSHHGLTLAGAHHTADGRGTLCQKGRDAAVHDPEGLVVVGGDLHREDHSLGSGLDHVDAQQGVHVADLTAVGESVEIVVHPGKSTSGG